MVCRLLFAANETFHEGLTLTKKFGFEEIMDVFDFKFDLKFQNTKKKLRAVLETNFLCLPSLQFKRNILQSLTLNSLQSQTATV